MAEEEERRNCCCCCCCCFACSQHKSHFIAIRKESASVCSFIMESTFNAKALTRQRRLLFLQQANEPYTLKERASEKHRAHHSSVNAIMYCRLTDNRFGNI